MSRSKSIIIFIVLLVTFPMLFFVIRSKGASVGTAVQIVAATLVIALAIVGLLVFLDRLHFKKLLKFSSFVQTQEEERGGWLAGILALLVAFAVSKWTFILLEYFVICDVYGHEAWVHGLRVAHKSVLSNGDVLSGWPWLILNFGTFVVTAPFFIGSFLLFRYIGFRLQRRRLSDLKPKKKWISSGKSDSAD
jgi:hypothetical protein